MLLMGNQPTRWGPFMSRLLLCWIPSEVCGICLLKGITDLLHLGLQLYNSFASWHEAATGGLIPYPIQLEPFKRKGNRSNSESLVFKYVD